MKRFLLLSVIACCSLTAKSQISAYYQFNSPLPMMGASLTNANGGGFDMLYPVCKSGFSIGISFSASFYGYQRTPYSIMTDSTTLNTHLNINNYFYQVGLASKYYLPIKLDRFKTFFETKTSATFFQTDLNIEDPEDVDNCAPLEEHKLFKDVNASATLNFGFEFLLKEDMFDCGEENSPSMSFFMSGGFTFGGRISYMNVETEPSHYHHQGIQEPDKNPVFVDFINTDTQVVHEHHVGYLYTTPIRMYELKAGFVFKL